MADEPQKSIEYLKEKGMPGLAAPAEKKGSGKKTEPATEPTEPTDKPVEPAEPEA